MGTVGFAVEPVASGDFGGWLDGRKKQLCWSQHQKGHGVWVTVVDFENPSGQIQGGIAEKGV